MKNLDIEISVTNDPLHGPTVTINFSEKIRSFGLNDEKAEAFARFILEKVREIRAKD